jgi:hypothetical protein
MDILLSKQKFLSTILSIIESIWKDVKAHKIETFQFCDLIIWNIFL